MTKKQAQKVSIKLFFEQIESIEELSKESRKFLKNIFLEGFEAGDAYRCSVIFNCLPQELRDLYMLKPEFEDFEG